MPSDVPLVWAVGDRCRVFVRDREREGIVCRVLPIEVDVAVEGMGILYLSRDELRLSRIEEERALLRRAVGVASELERLREEVSGVLDAFARGVQKKGNGHMTFDELKAKSLAAVRALEEPLDDEGVATMMAAAEVHGRREELARCMNILGDEAMRLLGSRDREDVEEKKP